MTESTEKLQQIIEAALLAAGEALNIKQLQSLFEDGAEPKADELRKALESLGDACEDRGVELVEVSSGWRLQVRSGLMPWVSRLWEERPQRYSRALMETLALIAYRQPVTRGEIEEVRGVSVSSSIVRTLQEREWIRVVGYRDVPGKPALFGTTRAFLDYFNLSSLEQLPSLAEIQELTDLDPELEFPDQAGTDRNSSQGDDSTESNTQSTPGGDDEREDDEQDPEQENPEAQSGQSQRPEAAAASGEAEEPRDDASSAG